MLREPEVRCSLSDAMAEALAAVAQAALESPAGFRPAKRAVEALVGVVGNADATLFLRCARGSVLFPVAYAASGCPPAAPGRVRDECARLLGEVLDEGNLVLLSAESERPLPQDWHQLGFQWATILPLRTDGRAFGGMVLRGVGEVPPDAGTLRFLESMGRLAGLGILAKASPVPCARAEKAMCPLATVIKDQDEERARISRDLHEEANQLLTSLMIGLELLDRKVNDQPLRREIASLQAMVRQTFDGLHRIAQDLRPVALEKLGLGAALEVLCARFSEQHGIETSFYHVDKECPCRSEAIDTALYRIVQEALANVARHAQATHVSVVLACRDGLVTVQVEDNGKGWTEPADGALPDECLGIIGMKERAALLGGQVKIESSPAGGTTVYVEIPGDYEVVERNDAEAD